MAISKHEFYEGAALHQLVKAGRISSISWEAPFFVLDDAVHLLLKYCTRARSPWGFTLTSNEKRLLRERREANFVALGLVCGADGVLSLSMNEIDAILTLESGTSHVSCFRKHGHHYEVRGPDGVLPRKIAPSEWFSPRRFSDETS